MDLEKAIKVAELVRERSFVSGAMQVFMVDLKKASGDRDATTSVAIYARWLPVLIDKAAEELGELDRKIKEL